MARENTAAEYPELPFRLGDELDGLGRVIRIGTGGAGGILRGRQGPGGGVPPAGGVLRGPAGFSGHPPGGKDLRGSPSPVSHAPVLRPG